MCGTAAGIAPRLIHCTTPSRPARSIMSAVNVSPAVVGFRPDEDEQVAFLEPRPAQDEARPGQLGQAPVDDLERRAARPIVEQLVGVEGRDRRAVVGEDGQRRRGRRARIDPAIERGDQDGLDQVAGIVKRVQAHPRRIGDVPSGGLEADLGYTPPTHPHHRCIERTDRWPGIPNSNASDARRRPSGSSRSRPPGWAACPTADRQGVRRVGRGRSRPRARGEATGHGARHRAATATPRP